MYPFEIIAVNSDGTAFADCQRFMEPAAKKIIYSIEGLCEFMVCESFIEINVHTGIFDESQISQMVSTLDEISLGKQFLILVNPDKGARVTFMGLRKLASAQTLQYALARAYVLRSMHQKLMAELFMKVYSPASPIRFFREPEEAMKWLSEQALDRSA
jgi:hypothetical protein